MSSQNFILVTCEVHQESSDTGSMQLSFGQALTVRLPDCYREHLQQASPAWGIREFVQAGLSGWKSRPEGPLLNPGQCTEPA